MKNSFRILVLILLSIWVGGSLLDNKAYKELVIARAERSLPATPVKVQPVESRAIHAKLKVSGTVVGTNEVFVIPTVSGEVERLLIKPGSEVRRGQLLATIDSYYLQQQFELAEAAYEQDSKDLERLTSMAQVNAVTGQQLEQYTLKVAASETKMKLARRRLADAQIRATVSGTINQVFTSEGAMIGPGRPICEIVGGPFNIIKAGIPERYRAYVEPGRPVRLMDFQSEFPTNASILALGIKPNQLGKVPLEVTFEPIDPLFAGRLVDVEIDVATDSALFLPIEAVRTTLIDNYVLVVNDSRAEQRRITIKEQINGFVRVIEGLSIGDQVILEGRTLVHPGDSLRIVTE